MGIEETVARHKIKAECLKADEDPLVFDQQVYLSAKTNRYDTGMSSEFLMKHLMQLDNCLSYGCASIRRSRKALVCRIKELMAQADCLSQRWLKRVKVLEKLKAEVPACVSSGETADDTHIAEAEEAITMDEEERADDSEDSAPEMDIESDDEMGEGSDDEADEGSDDEADEGSDDEADEGSDNGADEDVTMTSNDQTTAPCSSEPQTETKQTESAHLPSLPSWQPRTQMYHDGSHVVVAAFVPGMSMDKFNMMVDGTDLLVTGNKQPTMQDIISYRHGRAPNFGNLNLKISLPTDVVHTEGATATYEDGILRVKFIKKQTPQYRRPARRQTYREPMHYQRPMFYQQPRRNFFNHPMGFW